MVVADEAALKQLWLVLQKGWGDNDTDVLYGFKCSNVVAHISRRDVHDASGVLVSSCITTFSQCRLQICDAIYRYINIYIYIYKVTDTQLEYEKLRFIK